MRYTRNPLSRAKYEKASKDDASTTTGVEISDNSGSFCGDDDSKDLATSPMHKTSQVVVAPNGAAAADELSLKTAMILIAAAGLLFSIMTMMTAYADRDLGSFEIVFM